MHATYEDLNVWARKEGNNLSGKMKGVNVMIWHCVGREIIDEKSLNLTWVLDLEAQASHHYSIVNRQRKNTWQ